MLISPHATQQPPRPLWQRPAGKEPASGYKLPASGLLMSDAKLFHHVLSVAQMVLEYLETAL